MATKQARLDSALNGVQALLLDSRAATGILALILFVAGILLVTTDTMNHDVAWYYYGAERLADGAKLYVDLIDPNPPLVFYVDLPAVWLARALGLPDQAAFIAYMAALLAGALGLWYLTARTVNVPEGAATRHAFLLVLIVFLFPFHDFGQREHLVLALLLPYLFVVAGRAAGRQVSTWLALPAGLLAGPALVMKPFYLVLWPVLELYLILARRAGPPWRRPENWAIALVAALYGLFIVLVTPEYLGIVRIALAIYSGYNQAFLLVIRYPSVWLTLLVVATWLLLLRATAPQRILGDVLSLVSLTTLALALQQGKGWSYHFYPNSVSTIMLVLVVLGAAVARLPHIARAVRLGSTLTATLVVLVLVAVSGIRLLGYPLLLPNGTEADLARVVHAHARPGDYIFVFSTSISPAFPLVNSTDTRWATSIQPLWMLPGLYPDLPPGTSSFPYHRWEDMGEIERFMLERSVAELSQRQPMVMIVDTSPGKQGLGFTGFDYLEYFSRVPGFAELWAHYGPVATIDQYTVYARR